MKWGKWNLEKENFTLNHKNGYEIDLEELDTSAEVLDWICQVADKEWADEKCIADLVKAFIDILDPQANLCSGGCHKTIDPTAKIREYIESLGVYGRRKNIK
jgi:hypothetical protein